MNLLNLEMVAFSNAVFTLGEDLRIEILPNRFMTNSPSVIQVLSKINQEIQRGDKSMYLFHCQNYAGLIRKERLCQPNFPSITLSGNYESIFDNLMTKGESEVEVHITPEPVLKEIEISISATSGEDPVIEEIKPELSIEEEKKPSQTKKSPIKKGEKV